MELYRFGIIEIRDEFLAWVVSREDFVCLICEKNAEGNRRHGHGFPSPKEAMFGLMVMVPKLYGMPTTNAPIQNPYPPVVGIAPNTGQYIGGQYYCSQCGFYVSTGHKCNHSGVTYPQGQWFPHTIAGTSTTYN